MKLLYPALIGTALAANTLTLTGRNIKDLENRIREKFTQKQNFYLNKYAQTNLIRRAGKAKLSSDLSDALLDYNMEKEGCQIKTAGFWDECRQCITQKCTQFLQDSCDIKSQELAAQFTEHSPEIQEIMELLQSIYKNGQLGNEMQVDLKIDNGLELEIGGNKREKRYAKAQQKNNTRQKRQADDCGVVEVTCNSGCDQIEFQQFNQVVCVEDPAPQTQIQGLPHFDATKTSNWHVSAEGNYKFVLGAEEAGSDGQARVTLDLSGLWSGQESEGEVERQEEDPSYYPQNAETDEYYDEEDYVVDQEYDNQEYDDADRDFNNQEYFLAASIPSDKYIDDSLKKYCDERIGGCDSDSLLRRRRHRNRRSANRQDDTCEMVMAEPMRCRQLGLSCSACETKIADVCPDYHQVRLNFAAKLATANEFFERLDTTANEQEEILDWFGAMADANGEASLYIQRAYFDPNTDTVALAIGVGSGDLAFETIATGKLPVDISFEEFAEAVAEEVADGVVEGGAALRSQ